MPLAFARTEKATGRGRRGVKFGGAPNRRLQRTGGPQPVGPPYAGLKILEHTGLSGQPLKLAFDAARQTDTGSESAED